MEKARRHLHPPPLPIRHSGLPQQISQYPSLLRVKVKANCEALPWKKPR
jgi:hypothetical protein